VTTTLSVGTHCQLSVIARPARRSCGAVHREAWSTPLRASLHVRIPVDQPWLHAIPAPTVATTPPTGRHNRLDGRHNQTDGRHNQTVGRHNPADDRHNLNVHVTPSADGVLS
jgi:hypothetical protein